MHKRREKSGFDLEPDDVTRCSEPRGDFTGWSMSSNLCMCRCEEECIPMPNRVLVTLQGCNQACC